MHFIKTLLDGDQEDWIHTLFTRYGRGEYVGPVCNLTVKGKIKFKGTYDCANAFGLVLAKNCADMSVSGSIFAKKDFRDILRDQGLEFDDKSKEKKGVFIVDINEESLPSGVLLNIYEQAPWTNALLNIKSKAGSLKTKKKPPKPGKEKALDFLSGSLDKATAKAIGELILLQQTEFTEACVEHIYNIKELVIPDGMSAAQARLDAKRKGTLIRAVTIDGEKSQKEVDLLV